jgi:diaminopimelate decarboxylase
MDNFIYRNNELFVENVPVTEIIKQFGSPCYIYSKKAFVEHWQTFETAFRIFSHRICYAVKANSNIAILNILAHLGAGFDIVSVGELERVLHAGGNPQKIIFSGIGKQEAEIARALEVGIGCFNIESPAELVRINHIAQNLGRIAPIALRINPNIDAGTHPYITTGLKSNKFGIDLKEALTLYEQAMTLKNIQLVGIAFHIGSQHMELEPFTQALKAIISLIDILAKKNISLRWLDIGGGMGVRYQQEVPPTPNDYAMTVQKIIGSRPLEIIIEPGRAIAANAGILVTRVEYLKHTPHHDFAIVDAGMNDLIRPSLYQAWHDIMPVLNRTTDEGRYYDVVGPVCESGDFLGKQRLLNIKANDLLAVFSAGAYGFVMSSNYNSRPRAAEIMVNGDQYHLIRQRETIAELIGLEKLMPIS